MIVSILRLMRLYYALPLAGGFVVVLLYLRNGSLNSIAHLAAWGAASLAYLIAAAHVFNDLCDVPVDRINAPSRPLPSGKVSPGIAWVLAAALAACSLGCAARCGVAFFAAVAALAILLGAYNAFGKKMGFMKDVLAACLVTSLYPLAFLLVEPVHTYRVRVLFIHAPWLLLTALGYQMLKDVRDAAGDRLGGREVDEEMKTRFALWAGRIVLLAAVLLFIPFIAGWCGYIYLAATLIAAGLALLAANAQPRKAIKLIYVEVAVLTLGSLTDIVI